VNGQSNAEAQMYNGSANGNQSPFLRSSELVPVFLSCDADLSWRMAGPDLSQDPPLWTVGFEDGRLIVDTFQVPCVSSTKAYPGQPIVYFRRNIRILSIHQRTTGASLRVQQAGATNGYAPSCGIKGESDYDNAAEQEAGLSAAVPDWLIDYPSLERAYVHQVRPAPPGCQGDTIGTCKTGQRLYATNSRVFRGDVHTGIVDNTYNTFRLRLVPSVTMPTPVATK